MTRRRLVQSVAGVAASYALRVQAGSSSTIGLGLGNYGLKTYPTTEAIRFIASVGYDSVELTMMDGYTTEASRVPPQERRNLRTLLGELGLALPSLLEQIPILGSAADHQTHLERIKRDAQFGHDVNAGVGGVRPCVQTHLGGRSADWEKQKALVVDRLGNWASTGREMEIVVAFKGHNLNLNDTAEKTLWLIQQVNSPWLRVLYDYSHYQAVDESLTRTMELLLPHTAMISIKDCRKYQDKPGFERLLPGDGTIDYTDYYSRLVKFGYAGHTVVEISGQISSSPGYDAAASARRCYSNVALKMAAAGVRRPQSTNRARKSV